MADLFQQLRRDADRNARRAVRVYRRELPDYRRIEVSGGGPAAMLDFAVFLRRRTIDLAAAEQPFTADDLAVMESVGEERGARGVSAAAQRQVLTLHSTLTLQEIREAAGPDDVAGLMRVLRWIGPQGVTAQDAYTRGFVAGQRRTVPFAARVQRLAQLLTTDDPASGALAADLALPFRGALLVTVVRVHGDVRPFTDAVRAATVEELLRVHRVPMMWREPAEFVVVTPAGAGAARPSGGGGVAQPAGSSGAAQPSGSGGAGRPSGGPARSGRPGGVGRPAWPDGLAVARALADAVGRPCAVGTAPGRAGQLAGAADLARRVSRVAPAGAPPDHAHTVADVLVEVAVAQLPEADRWLDDLVRRLGAGPDLVETLAAYYDHDMNRSQTAAALNIHPRTLDYRLRRAHELLGIHPATTRGVRLIGAGIALHRLGRGGPQPPPAA